jgi:thiamine phosphate synthase YjbQ (UPF0047 family)
VKHARKELWFEVPERRGYLNITPQVEEFVGESRIANGLCLGGFGETAFVARGAMLVPRQGRRERR